MTRISGVGLRSLELHREDTVNLGLFIGVPLLSSTEDMAHPGDVQPLTLHLSIHIQISSTDV